METQDLENEVFYLLLANKEIFETTFGGELFWEEIEGRKSYKLGISLKDANILQRESRTSQLAWLMDTQERLRLAFELIRKELHL